MLPQSRYPHEIFLRAGHLLCNNSLTNFSSIGPKYALYYTYDWWLDALQSACVKTIFDNLSSKIGYKEWDVY